MSGPRHGLFIVFEGIDGSGKTFHLDAVKDALISHSRAIHSIVSRIIVPRWEGS